MSVVALGTDPEDGGAVWTPVRGTELVPGQLAWAPLATGHHCQTWLCWSVELWVPTLVKLARPGWSISRSAGGPVTAAMDVYSIGATLRAVVDPADDAGALGAALDGLSAAAPADRPTVDRALAMLVRHAGHGGERHWPRWADGSLPRTPTG